MILAHPDSDLRKNLMVVGADIVRLLTNKKRHNNFVLVEDLMEDFLKVSEERTPDMFLDALSLLFSVGLVESKEYKVKLIVNKKMGKTPSQMVLF